jgi:putative transport protein
LRPYWIKIKIKIRLYWTVSFLMARWLSIEPALATGVFAGTLTSTPGLGAVTKLADNSAPSTAYVAVYPMALLLVSLLAPLLGMVLGM